MIDYGTLFYSRRGDAAKQIRLRLGSIAIGRDSANDIVLDDEGISRYHARIVCATANCLITDLGSTNGTFLNQVRLRPQMPQSLRHGDTILIGQFAIRYLQSDQTLESEEGQSQLAEEPIPTPATQQTQPTQTLNSEPVDQLSKSTNASLPKRPLDTRPNMSNPLSVEALPASLARRRSFANPPQQHQSTSYINRENSPIVSSYMQYLPPRYHEQDFLNRFLSIFESILEPLDQMIGQLPNYFDPRLAPETLLPWLATWVGLALNENWPIERRRELISAASELYKWRGTRHGLIKYIRTYTGVEPTVIEPHLEDRDADISQLPDHTFRVILVVDDLNHIDRTFVEAIIDAEKPAHTSYILEIRQSSAEASEQ